MYLTLRAKAEGPIPYLRGLVSIYSSYFGGQYHTLIPGVKCKNVVTSTKYVDLTWGHDYNFIKSGG